MYPLILLFSIFFNFLPKDTVLCNQPNTALIVGEKINYTIFYNVVGLYVNAGKTDFVIQSSNWNGVDALTFTALGRSNSKYDWIFKVRDKYESIVDAKTLLPYQFTREINEGGFHHKESLLFNQKVNTVSNGKGIFKTPDCTYDVLCAIYAARNYNYKNRNINDKIYLNFFLDNELYPSYFKYLGKEIITTRYGKFKAIKLAPLLVKGTMFKGGEEMTIWITDDDNHLPVRIQSPIIVGTIKVDMVGFENLRHPLISLLELVDSNE
jgi:hypothetical protein